MYDVMTATQVAQAIYAVLITSVTVTGQVKIVGINIMVLSALVIPVIHAIVAFIKSKFPNLEKKAWLPITLGATVFIAVGISTGQITNLITLVTYLVTGLATGGLSSSIRDVFVGK